jgi:hypothetical protein
MAAAKRTYRDVTRVNGRSYDVKSNRKNPAKGKLIVGASGRVIGRSSPGRVTTFTSASGGSRKSSEH